jgi:hypothetical protein
VFGVELSREEKHDYARLRKNQVIPVIRKKEGGFLSGLKKNQASLDDFHDENGFLGRKQRYGRGKKQGVQREGSLRENEGTLAFFLHSEVLQKNLLNFLHEGLF